MGNGRRLVFSRKLWPGLKKSDFKTRGVIYAPLYDGDFFEGLPMADLEQRKYLQTLLSNASNKQKSWTDDPKPQAVKNAERIVKRWEKEQRNKEYEKREFK